MTCIPNPNEALDILRNNINLPEINVNIERLNAVSDQLDEAVADLTSGATSLIEQVGSIRGEINSGLESIRSQVTETLGSISLPELNLHSELQSALRTLTTAPNDFLSRIENIRASFPNVNIDEALQGLCDGSFSLEELPNVELINGSEIVRAIAPDLNVSDIPSQLEELVDLPEIRIPEIVTPELMDITNIRVNVNGALQMTREQWESHRAAILGA